MKPEWLANIIALVLEEREPYPEELKPMEEAGLILWYDYWLVTDDGHKAAYRQLTLLPGEQE